MAVAADGCSDKLHKNGMCDCCYTLYRNSTRKVAERKKKRARVEEEKMVQQQQQERDRFNRIIKALQTSKGTIIPICDGMERIDE